MRLLFEHAHLQVNDRKLSCLALLIVDLRVNGGPWVRVRAIRLVIRMAIRTAMKNVRLRSPDLRRIVGGENMGQCPGVDVADVGGRIFYYLLRRGGGDGGETGVSRGTLGDVIETPRRNPVCHTRLGVRGERRQICRCCLGGGERCGERRKMSLGEPGRFCDVGRREES